MRKTQRRTFLKTTGFGVTAWTVGRRTARAATAAERLVVGVIGTGGMGSHHVRQLVANKNVDVAILCDVDQRRLGKAVRHVEEAGRPAPRAVGDLRRVLDDPHVDAVLIATPDHWHGPASILALDAGKHVYVEKPCCHNIREGRLMADAAERTGKVLQVGTQSRSTDCVREAMARVHAGEIGEVMVAKAWNCQRRGSIGKTKPSQPPKELDFDAWVGPAPMVPYRSNLLPSIWRWWYAFGCGDIGNDGVHDIDVALWGLQATEHPSTVSCHGGKYVFDDDQQFPDTQYAVCEYDAPGAPSGRKRQFIFEQRIWSPYTLDGYSNGAAFYGTQGVMIVGHTVGWRLYGPGDKLIAERKGHADLTAHHRNFFDVVRGRANNLNAPIMAGHRAATIVHLANIAARRGHTIHFDPATETIRDDPQAASMVGRTYRAGHWAVPAGAG
ncbi:MAG: Gfo/Idh/MocA family protein [Pirellulales bacterium]